MAAMFSNNQQSISHCNRNQPFSSIICPNFSEEQETVISRQITKKPRLASWGCGDGYFNKFDDIRYNPNQSLASSIPPFFHEQETLISQQNRRLEAPWWSVDKSLDELSVIFKKPPPITSNSTAGDSKPPPIPSTLIAGISKPPPIPSTLIAGISKPPPITSNSTPGVLKPPPEVIAIDEDELIEEGIPELSDFIFENTPPISSPSSSVVSKSPPEVIIVIDDDVEEEIVAISNDNNPKFDFNGKESSSIKNNEEDSGSVVIDSEKKKNGGDGGFGHVSLDEWGVTVEELRNIPWEAFDPNWEIKSAIMDPWLGPYT